MSLENVDLEQELDPFVVNEDDLNPGDYEDLSQEADIFDDFNSSKSNVRANEVPIEEALDFDEEEEEEEEDIDKDIRDIDLDNEDDDGDSLSFDSDDADDDAGDLTEDKLIEKLKSLNYEVKKKEEIDPLEEERKSIELNKTFISQAVDFISQSDEVVVEGKLRNDLINKFKKEGRSVDSYEFKEELEEELEGYLGDKRMLKNFADIVRNQVQTNAIEKKSEIEKIESNIQERTKKQQQEVRRKVQSAFNDIRKSDFYGIDVSDDDYRAAYKDLTTGKVAKKIEDNPSLAAEVALYLRKKAEFSKKLGGPTYGEGVRDTVKSILGDDVSKPSTQRVMRNGKNSAKRDGLSSRSSFWRQGSSKKDDKTDKNKAFGYPGSF